MRHSLLFTMLLAVASSNSLAQTVSESEARSMALAFISQSHRARGNAANDIELAYTSATESETHYYVFNYGKKSEGFVIVGGDKRAREILGYSDNGPFDYDSAPDNFKWWLSQYDQEIHARIEQNVQPFNAAPRRDSRVDIRPLMTTKWSQTEPFNNQIAPNATGCVATAMAQVMRYYKYPAQGTGSHSYTTRTSETTYSANFSESVYDWKNMIDDYRGSYKDAQADAVAQLMYDAGVSVNMDYGASSGAFSLAIPIALSTYFGYDKSAELVERKNYTDEAWLDLIYGELAAGRPVIYSGQNTYGGGGHEFVCHGYRASDQTFAISWGWSGLYDGYFTLMGKDGLQPSGSGIGGAGANASYTDDQDIIINVMPDRGGEPSARITIYDGPELYQNYESVETASIDLSQTVKALAYRFYFVNYSGTDQTYEFTTAYRDKSSGSVFYSKSTSKSTASSVDLSTGVYSIYSMYIEIESKDFECDGIYEVLPAVRILGNSKWQILSTASAKTIVVSGGNEAEVEPRPITFGISGTTVEERSTLQITHDENYNGKITYSAKPKGIVSIDDEGLVTGLKAGNVTITVRGEKAAYYQETTATFNVTVNPYEKKSVKFSISKSKIQVGKTSQIICNTPNYTGNITYQSEDASIAKVDENGVITALSAGNTNIIVHAAEDNAYNAATIVFAIRTVVKPVALVECYMPNHGYFIASDMFISASFLNISGETILDRHYITLSFACGIVSGTKRSAMDTWNKDAILTFDFDMSGKFANDSFIGEEGTFHFEDEENILSDDIHFYLCDKLFVDYTMSEVGWGTICLPYEANVPDGLTAYRIAGSFDNQLTLEEVDFMEMNTPYLLTGNAGTYSFLGPDTTPYFQGPFHDGLMYGNTKPSTDEAPVYAPAGSYVLQQNKNGNLGFYQVKEDNTQRLRQYSAYLSNMPAGSAANAYYFNIDAEGIDEIESDETCDSVAYGINGQRVEASHKGLTVRNGKISFIK